MTRALHVVSYECGKTRTGQMVVLEVLRDPCGLETARLRVDRVLVLDGLTTDNVAQIRRGMRKGPG